MELLQLKRPFELHPLTHTDIPALLTVENQSFPDPAQALKYEQELENKLASYCTLHKETNGRTELIGYGGIWLLANEIHIMEIAVLPTYRRQQFGQLLLYQLLLIGLACGGTSATLEVRNSNKAAQHLYQKYQFIALGKRKNYYRNPLEDGIIMTLEAVDHSLLTSLFTPIISRFSITN